MFDISQFIDNERFGYVTRDTYETLYYADYGYTVRGWAMEQVAEPEAFRVDVEALYEDPETTARDELELADGRVFDRYTAPVVAEDGTRLADCGPLETSRT